MLKINNIKNIVFSGGGLKGWAYIGTLRALYELVPHDNIEECTGASIGSLFALLYILKINWASILQIIINLDFKEVADIDIDSILVNQSMIAGEKYSDIIIKLCENKINKKTTFKEFYEHTGIKYTVPALNISKRERMYFNYINTPDTKILDAIIASSSVPVLFPAYCIDNNYYYDGGLFDNTPSKNTEELGTLCFCLCDSHEMDQTVKILSLIHTLSELLNRTKTNNNIKLCVLDDKYSTEIYNINQSRDTIFNIYMNGYKNTKNLLFDNFLAIKN